MRIVRIEVYGYELTYRHGTYGMSGGRVVRTLPSTVVRILTDEGLEGWGEVCPLGSTYLPAFAEGARAALRELLPPLVGLDPRDLAVLHRRMDSTLRGFAFAKSPVDMACWDLVGKATGLPVYLLLGGRWQERFPLYVAVPLRDAGEMADFVREQRALGVRRFQLKVGTAPQEDLARVRAVLDVTGEEEVVIADANGAYRLHQAAVLSRLLAGVDRVILEQPCPTLEECRALRGGASLPLILDEVVTDVREVLEAVGMGAVGINLKISRFGGLTGSRLVRDLAQELGLSLIIEDTWGGDLVTAAASHLAASTRPEAFLAASFMNDWVLEHVAGHQPRSQGGFGAPPPGPGLGVEVDRSGLRLLFATEGEGG
ncbi:MAG: mandelate racemase/muconate lactonizing enzyme family protein [Armatimonadota bacterium]|nr:mandelate racemase/muconate lactonizing enzyme family protein [Armatimonadota bacterium]MDR7443813.1 mandelate racemase/muconate lactonizing enzyme family protein [Armatimonadota bacterium]MDR7569018.1 mandelate racemase/muconate lactonizing enzyme family protein [Armatimonadota bacterium]MDR7613907.1 mandelate racemase/muconate lactonizing enzyme family protein [Armatimonadota bacterium]